MTQLRTPPNLATKLVGRPARPCSTCGSRIVWVNAIGGVACPVCRPPSSSDAVRGWLEASGPESGPTWAAVSPSNPTTSTTASSAPTPSLEPLAHLYVSTRLDSFVWPLDGRRFAQDVTIVVEEGERLDTPPYAYAGIYRRLDLRYAAWLLGVLRGIEEFDEGPRGYQDEGMRLLGEIAREAVRLRVLSEEDKDPTHWPDPVKGYRPPVACEETWE